LDEDGGFTDSNSGKCSKSGSFQPESVATLRRNRWQLSTGIGGSFTPEYAGKVIHSGITKDLERREQEHKEKYHGGHIVQVGRKTTEEAAREWEEKQKKA
jgi:hypothetical protein